MNIGVFDSGVGGQSVAKAIKQANPHATVTIRQDRANVPYGNKTPNELMHLVLPIFKDMVANGCDVIVVACNTVSTTIIKPLRAALPIPLVAMEPMIKPAAEQTRSGIIAVCATPTTLASERYQWLKATYASKLTVLEPNCADWAFMIEHQQIDDDKIAQLITDVLQQGADVIVLGCTHYHWIEQQIKLLCQQRAQVIQPEQPVVAQLRRVIERLT